MFTVLTNVLVISGFYLNCTGYVIDHAGPSFFTDEIYKVRLQCEKNGNLSYYEKWIKVEALKEIK